MLPDNEKRLLVLDSNPDETPALRTSEEIRIITDSCERSKRRDDYEITVKTSVTGKHFRRAILDVKPHIVHICGHGSGAMGIVFEDEFTNHAQIISTSALVGALKLAAPPLSCVVFNVCDSELQAEQTVQHVPYVIGMSSKISDRGALKFAEGFYDGVFAGETFTVSFEWGVNAIQTAGIADYGTPRLKTQQPLLTAFQIVVDRYYYENRIEEPTILGDTGFTVQRMHAQVWQIIDFRTSQNIFVEQTSINLFSKIDNFSHPYTSEWVFEEVKKEGVRRLTYPIETVANIRAIRRIGLDGSTPTQPNKDLARRFEEAKEQLSGMFPVGIAKWRKNEADQLEKIIDYGNGKPPELFVYQRLEK